MLSWGNKGTRNLSVHASQHLQSLSLQHQQMLLAIHTIYPLHASFKGEKLTVRKKEGKLGHCRIFCEKFREYVCQHVCVFGHCAYDQFSSEVHLPFHSCRSGCPASTHPNFKQVAIMGILHKILEGLVQREVYNDGGFATHPVQCPEQKRTS